MFSKHSYLCINSQHSLSCAHIVTHMWVVDKNSLIEFNTFILICFPEIKFRLFDMYLYLLKHLLVPIFLLYLCNNRHWLPSYNIFFSSFQCSVIFIHFKNVMFYSYHHLCLRILEPTPNFLASHWFSDCFLASMCLYIFYSLLLLHFVLFTL